MDFETQRRNMVDSQIRPSDVTDRRIIAALSSVPREQFVSDDAQKFAYMDADVSLSPGSASGQARSLLAPRTFAKLLQLAEIDAGDSVLIVGSGTGYSAAVLSRLDVKVVALECDRGLSADAERRLSALGVPVTSVVGDLTQGYLDDAPYDAIIVEGALPEMPQVLLEQLKDGGRLSAIVSGHGGMAGGVGKAVVWHRRDGIYAQREAFDVTAEVLPGFARTVEFAF
jgi:protein-L-isoaspartate(D-aspartate) O-methyltransferase